MTLCPHLRNYDKRTFVCSIHLTLNFLSYCRSGIWTKSNISGSLFTAPSSSSIIWKGTKAWSGRAYFATVGFAHCTPRTTADGPWMHLNHEQVWWCHCQNICFSGHFSWVWGWNNFPWGCISNYYTILIWMYIWIRTSILNSWVDMVKLGLTFNLFSREIPGRPWMWHVNM